MSNFQQPVFFPFRNTINFFTTSINRILAMKDNGNEQ